MLLSREELGCCSSSKANSSSSSSGKWLECEKAPVDAEVEATGPEPVVLPPSLDPDEPPAADEDDAALRSLARAFARLAVELARERERMVEDWY